MAKPARAKPSVVLLVVAIGSRARLEQPLDRSSRPDIVPRNLESAPPNS
jgi:hypothetical protein